jgi:ribonucleoside-diphosphate reductase subunit M1
MSYQSLYVVKRDGQHESVQFDKISRRISALLCDAYNPERLCIDPTIIAQKVCSQIYAGVSTTELDELASQICTSMQTEHVHYRKLAARIIISNHHKTTHSCYLKTARALFEEELISNELFGFIESNASCIQAAFQFQRDFEIDYFGFKTLERSYLLRINGVLVERPQFLWMRVALGLYMPNLEKALTCYDELSSKCYTHATPTLFNCGTNKNQLASCFLLTMQDDSIDGIFDTLKQCALISKYAGGIGLSVHNIRATGSRIHGTNGTSNGLVPMLRVFNDTARYVDQGGGKRNGSFAIYVEPWHADIVDFLHMKRNHGTETSRARDLFYALWTPDLFMQRVKDNGPWTLFDPKTAPGLADVHGAEFTALYETYEREGKGNETMPAQKLWAIILDSLIETGTPYLLFKDACNAKSNQQNLGMIKSSNLCTEIVEYSSPTESAVCNLASISLPSIVVPVSLADIAVTIHSRADCLFCKIAIARIERLGGTARIISYTDTEADKRKYREAFPTAKTYPTILFDDKVVGGYTELVMCTRAQLDYDKLERLTRALVRNLNRTIDTTFYPTPSTRRSNLKRRPIGIGVQGLSDVFFKLHYAFDSIDARTINKRIFASIYYAAVSESVQLAKEREVLITALRTQKASNDDPNALFTEQMHFAPDVVERDATVRACAFPGAYDGFETSPIARGKFQFDLWDDEGGDARYDWDGLRHQIGQFGIRNSLLVAPMPTASTAQILGNTECFEPITSNLYLRRTLAGEFVMVNQYMQQDLIDMGLWSSQLKDELLFHEGSLQHMTQIPQYFRNIYKTVWDISQKVIIDMAADRGRYICQSQSMNLFLAEAKPAAITSMLFYTWQKGLKTGIYYLRTKPSSKAQQFTLDPSKFGTQYTQEDEPCTSCSA